LCSLPCALRLAQGDNTKHLDRIDVNEDAPGSEPPLVVRHNWQVPGIFSPPDASIVAEPGDVAASRAQLADGTVVVGRRDIGGGAPIRGDAPAIGLRIHPAGPDHRRSEVVGQSRSRHGEAFALVERE
jgi:hypothetical protein